MPWDPKSNHDIVLTGWDDARGIFIIKNSWGRDQTNDGYLRISYGDNRSQFIYNPLYYAYEVKEV